LTKTLTNAFSSCLHLISYFSEVLLSFAGSDDLFFVVLSLQLLPPPPQSSSEAQMLKMENFPTRCLSSALLGLTIAVAPSLDPNM